jgi:hypothetical protein
LSSKPFHAGLETQRGYRGDSDSPQSDSNAAQLANASRIQRSGMEMESAALLLDQPEQAAFNASHEV